MANFIVEVSDELKEEMDKCPNMNWSLLVQKEIRQHLNVLKSNQSLQKP
ncbi:MAG: hypothetical protein AABX04_04675 [Nanoarchaeota archaeon]